MRRLVMVAAGLGMLVLPASAHGETTICAQTLPGPQQGSGWELDRDGSLKAPLTVGNGVAFASQHGGIRVKGQGYPQVPDGVPACDTTATRVEYPPRDVGPVMLSRSVSVVDNALRHLDSLTNTSENPITVDVAFVARTGASTISTTSSGDTTVDAGDIWAVFNGNGLFGSLQFGTASPGAPEPPVAAATAGGAQIDYTSVTVAPGDTERVLHVSAVAANEASAAKAAADGARSLVGYSLATARKIFNWGTDADGDGVPKDTDACPALKGALPNGCVDAVADPVHDPAAAPTPTATPEPNDPHAPPVVRVFRPTKTITRRALKRTGVRISVSCLPACRMRAQLRGRRRGEPARSRLASSDVRSLSRSRRTIAVKVKGAIKLERRQRLKLVVTVADRDGDEARVVRRVKLRR